MGCATQNATKRNNKPKVRRVEEKTHAMEESNSEGK